MFSPITPGEELKIETIYINFFLCRFFKFKRLDSKFKRFKSRSGGDWPRVVHTVLMCNGDHMFLLQT